MSRRLFWRLNRVFGWMGVFAIALAVARGQLGPTSPLTPVLVRAAGYTVGVAFALTTALWLMRRIESRQIARGEAPPAPGGTDSGGK